MNKKHKNNINKNKYMVACRCDRYIDEMIQDYMEIQNCDRSSAIRYILQFVLEMGGAGLIK